MQIITIIWFLIFTKLLFFCLWLWQLKEYRLDRLRAHFEVMAFEKIISGFWRIKYPKFTKKTILIILSCLAAEILLLFYVHLFFAVFFTFFLIPIIILFFQIPVFIWRKNIIRKAGQKIDKLDKLLVIGITGSYGKTSVKEFLTTILSSKFNVLSTPAHQNTDTAIARLILKKLTKDTKIFIVEMAAYKKGEITSPCQIVKPKIGILTAVNEQHLSTYGSLENTIQTKYELIEFLPENGLAIFNGDNNYTYQLYKMTQKQKRIYSIQSSIASIPVDLHTSSLAVNREFLSFKLIGRKGESAIFKVNLLGGHNLSNILAAACCARELGMSLEEIASACQKIESRQSGIQLKKGIGGLNIIDATYSANPDGVLSHLEYLNIWPGRKVIVMPCLIELGDASKRIHREIGRKIGQVCDLCIITSRDRFQEIGQGAIEKGMKSKNVLFTDDSDEIFKKIKDFLKESLPSCSSFNYSSYLSSDSPPKASIKDDFPAKKDIVLLESRVPDRLINLLTVNDKHA